jgi:very-short-patch-repair endonuclease
VKSPEELRIYAEKNRANPTPCEKIFLERLKAASIDFRFQFVIRGYIVDFVIPHKRYCIEIDDDRHQEEHQTLRDGMRDQSLSRCGFPLTRINNCEAATHPLDFLDKRETQPDTAFKRLLDWANEEYLKEYKAWLAIQQQSL